MAAKKEAFIVTARSNDTGVSSLGGSKKDHVETQRTDVSSVSSKSDFVETKESDDDPILA